jgi:hypothetical protein
MLDTTRRIAEALADRLAQLLGDTRMTQGAAGRDQVRIAFADPDRRPPVMQQPASTASTGNRLEGWQPIVLAALSILDRPSAGIPTSLD